MADNPQAPTRTPTMTDNLEELERLLAKATPGDWDVDSEYDNDALYSGGGGCGSGFKNFFIGADVDGSWKTLLDTQNSDYKLIEEDYDEGSNNAWDEIGRNNAALIVALKNAAPALIATAREVEGLRAEVARLNKRWAMIDGLRSQEGHSVEIIHDNADYGGPNCAVRTTTDFGVNYAVFYGPTIDDCLEAALEGKGG